MKTNENGVELYRIQDLITVAIGIPIVVIVAIVCANFVTSYAGI